MIRRSVFTLALLSLAVFQGVLSAQSSLMTPQEVAPLKNWVAPLYFRSTPMERMISGKPQAPSAAHAELSVGVAAGSGNLLVFVAMTPCRVIDTRSSYTFPAPFGAPSLVGGATRSFPMQASTLCSIPATAQAYSLNATVVPSGSLPYLTLWPFGIAQPNASTLNSVNGSIVANAAIVPAGSDPSGSIDAFAYSGTDLIIDINGFYAPIDDVGGNVFLGTGALISNSGLENVAIGADALHGSNSGSGNTATGFAALSLNTAGYQNTANGTGALQGNTLGFDNTATGDQALLSNTTGFVNTALGVAALHSNTTGGSNTAAGGGALANATTGSRNIGLGYGAGSNIATGSDNIDIGNVGTSIDSRIVRIGSWGAQTQFIAAGINGITTGFSNAVPVVIDSNGQLGTVNSSARFKEDIHDMADASSGLLQLRPVTYRYKQPYTDGSKPIDYGLIAEEVAEVYPDLVARNADGEIETVQYQKLTPMLLNELQKQHEDIVKEHELNRKLEERLAAVEALLSGAPPAKAATDK